MSPIVGAGSSWTWAEGWAGVAEHLATQTNGKTIQQHLQLMKRLISTIFLSFLPYVLELPKMRRKNFETKNQ